MKQHTAFAKHGTDGRDIRLATQFIVDHHQADQSGIVPERIFNLLTGHPPVRARFEPGHLNTLPFKPLAGIKHRLVFNHRCHNVRIVLACNSTLDGEVVGLGSAGRSHNLTWVCMYQACHLPAGTFNGSFGLPAKAMGA